MGGSYQLIQNMEESEIWSEMTGFLWINYPEYVHRFDQLWKAVKQQVWGRRSISCHIWDEIMFIPSIHSPYYYYESIIILIYCLNQIWDSCTIHL